jgi:hypothetical protein
VVSIGPAAGELRPRDAAIRPAGFSRRPRFGRGTSVAHGPGEARIFAPRKLAIKGGPVMRKWFLAFACLAAQAACSGDADGVNNESDADRSDSEEEAGGHVYIESNDPAGNAVLAFERSPDGSLTWIEGGTYDAGGPGISAGPEQRLGPLDSDQNLVLSEDGFHLFAVNAGGDSIAAFRIRHDGVLRPVKGSPFPSGGKNPVSLGVAGDTLHVVNKAADGSAPPSYTALEIGRHGSLEPIPDATVELPIGGSPSIAYISTDQRFLFGTEFLDGARPDAVPAEQIDVLHIGGDSQARRSLRSYPLPRDMSGIAPPPPPVALNLVAHPSENILYVAFVTRNQLGVYTFDDQGQLAFQRAVPNSGMAICWFLVDEERARLYSVNSASGSLSVYDISDPLRPVETSAIVLKQAMSGPPFIDAMGMKQTVTSQPFQLAFDGDRSHIYVVSQRATTNKDDPTGNYLHTLDVAEDGSLSEPSEPLDLRDVGVPPTARPQGVLVHD